MNMKPPSAFSLIEVVLAIGVVSFAFVGVLGLVPLGLKTSRQAIGINVETHIAQKISGDLQLSRFSSLTNSLFFETRYFDDEGGLLRNPSDPTRIYTVKAVGILQPTLPGGAAPNPSIRVVNFIIEQKTNPSATNHFSVVVADTGS